MSDTPQHSVGSPPPTRWDCLMALLIPPCTPMALVHLCTTRDAGPALGPTTVQRSKDWCQDEGHSPKNGPEPPGQGTKGCPKPGCPIPRRADVPQEPTPRRCGVPLKQACLGASRGGRRSVQSPAALEQPRGAQPGPGAPVQPSNGSLITRHHGGMEALADRRQSPRRYHRNNPHPAQASKGFVRVPVCAAPSPPSPCCFLCACTQERVGFFPLSREAFGTGAQIM